MTRSRKQKTETALEEPLPAPADPRDSKDYTQKQVAERVGCARTTILRMEQRNELPPPTWRRLPIPHRVYSEKDIAVIRAAIRRLTDKKGRVYLEDATDDAQANIASDEG